MKTDTPSGTLYFTSLGRCTTATPGLRPESAAAFAEDEDAAAEEAATEEAGADEAAGSPPQPLSVNAEKDKRAAAAKAAHFSLT